MKHLLLAFVMVLGGCAGWTQTKQCFIGVTFFGPAPIPMAGCDLIYTPDEGDDAPTPPKKMRVK